MGILLSSNSILSGTLAFGLPLFIIAIGGIFSERSGVTNLALEGFMGAGAFTGALVAVIVMQKTGMSSSATMWIALLAAAFGGALFSALHALLCVYLRADMVISGVVMNILSTALTAFLVTTINDKVFRVGATGKFHIGIAGTFTIPYFSKIPFIGGLFTDVYYYEILIIVIAALMYVVLYKTKFGLRLRACGEFPQAADSAGVNVYHVRFISVLISGALSGIGGLCLAYYLITQFDAKLFYLGYGYLSISALIFGGWKIIPTLGACMLFSFVKYFALWFATLPGINLSSVVTSTLFQALPYIITLVALIFFSKSNKAPAALGEIYDKGKR